MLTSVNCTVDSVCRVKINYSADGQQQMLIIDNGSGYVVLDQYLDHIVMSF